MKYFFSLVLLFLLYTTATTQSSNKRSKATSLSHVLSKRSFFIATGNLKSSVMLFRLRERSKTLMKRQLFYFISRLKALIRGLINNYQVLYGVELAIMQQSVRILANMKRPISAVESTMPVLIRLHSINPLIMASIRTKSTLYRTANVILCKGYFKTFS